jgi:acetyl esterase/lipase
VTRLDRAFVTAAALLAFVPAAARAAAEDLRVIPLWPEGVPGARADGGVERIENERVMNVQVPTLTYFPAAKKDATGTAVIVCPGGGYVRLAFVKEGEEYARFLNSLGVSAFVLKSRLVEYGQPAPLQDVLRAVRVVRSRAGEFGIREERIGVMGSSAGGHLASTAATLYDAPEGRTGAPLDAVSARPSFAVLVYPVITMKEPYAHLGSRRALLGENPSEELVDRFSTQLQVTKDTPPAFLVHTQEDASVPLENSVYFFQALRRFKVDAELHLFEKGPHGFGMGQGLGPTSEWPKRLETWMRSHGWLSP